jgi:hypothetical protein
MDLLDLTAQIRAIGRGSVFYAPGAFAGSGTALVANLVHLGDTEGEISIELNDSYSTLTLPELTGAAAHDKYLEGLDPRVTIPLYAADDALRAIVSPTGSASGGFQRRRAVTEYTMAILPEQVFIEANAQVTVDYTTAGGWTVGGDAATAAQEALLDLGIWFWRGHFTATPPMYKHEDGGKVVQQVVFHVMHNGAMPDGHHLFTIGRPEEATPAIEIHTA